MTTRTSSTKFTSIMYRSGFIYKLVQVVAFEFKTKFRILANIAMRNNAKTILDIGCGIGQITTYLDSNIIYEGWDLNQSFLEKIKKDWLKGKIKPKKVILRNNDIFNFEDYPDVDCIVLCDILHHISPRHIELVESVKEHAKRVVICDGFGKDNAQGQNWLSKTVLKAARHLPDTLMKYVDYFLGDNDGINLYEDRSEWAPKRDEILSMYESFDIQKEHIYHLDDEIIGVWENSHN